MDQPDRSEVGADRQNPATARYRCGKRPPVARPRRPRRRAGHQLWARSYADRTLLGSSSLSVRKECRVPGGLAACSSRPPARSDGDRSSRQPLLQRVASSSRLVHPLIPCPWRRRPRAAPRRRWCSGQPRAAGAAARKGRRADLQAQLWQGPSETRRMLVVDGLQPLESSCRRLLAGCGEARASWSGPASPDHLLAVFQVGQAVPAGSIRLLRRALCVRRFRAAVVTGASGCGQSPVGCAVSARGFL
jgi:hypothetical protein